MRAVWTQSRGIYPSTMCERPGRFCPLSNNQRCSHATRPENPPSSYHVRSVMYVSTDDSPVQHKRCKLAEGWEQEESANRVGQVVKQHSKSADRLPCSAMHNQCNLQSTARKCAMAPYKPSLGYPSECQALQIRPRKRDLARFSAAAHIQSRAAPSECGPGALKQV
jgi:hypothetical protein